MAKYVTSSKEETKNLAAKLARGSTDRVFALTGQLGVGKTTFVQGFAKGLGIKEKITSPTFILIRQHPIPKNKKFLYHIDLYRLENIEKFADLGLKEILSDPNYIVLIEWAEKVKEILPKNTLWISIVTTKKNSRLISF